MCGTLFFSKGMSLALSTNWHTCSLFDYVIAGEWWGRRIIEKYAIRIRELALLEQVFLCLDLWVVSKISLNSHRFLFMGGDCEYNQNVKIYGKPNYKGGSLGAAEKVQQGPVSPAACADG